MKRLMAAILCLLCLCAVGAQERKVQHRPYIDQRRFHYGFLFGVHVQDLELQNNGYIDPESGEQWYADVDNYGPGFSVGVLGEMRINTYLALRLVPTLHFGQKHVSFHEQHSGRDSTQNIKSTYISCPLDLKFSGPRFNNYRPYFIAGVNPMVDLTTKRQGALRLKPFDCYLEVGMGCDLYLRFFKLIPELKFCFSLTDALDKDHAANLQDPNMRAYANSVTAGSTKMFVLTFYFE